MTPEEQLDRWLAGDSQCPNDRDECCPDFSCCVDGIDTPVKVKQRFIDNPEARDSICMMFLGQLIAARRKEDEVHVAGMGAEH